MWVFGTTVEQVLGTWSTAAIYLLLAVGSSAAEHALLVGGVGLSGVGYGLFGLLWVLSRQDPRFAGAVDGRITALFLIWFVLCCILTATGVWNIGNIAHATGAVLGLILGFAIVMQGRRRVALGVVVAGAFVLTLLASALARPYINLASRPEADLAYLAYLDLQQGRNESAAKRYQLALARDRQQSDWWYNLGIAWERLDRMEEATDAYHHALDLKPSDKDYRTQAAYAKAQLAYRKQIAGNMTEAVRLYQESLAIDDHQATRWYNLGVAYQQLERNKSAREAYQRAVNLEPANDEFRAALKLLPQDADDPN